ncbi:MAG: cell division FtsA domain-containing protein [Candidatus Electryoneaceae bacterium]|nr:cell division FtsA domain-containing protein [Candidatus Electryoneaceae bacterium]
MTDATPAQDLITAINGAGIQVKSLVWGPLAIGEAVLSGAEKELGILLLDVGGSKTDATIFYGGSVRYTSTINYGGDDVTLDIAKVLGFSIEDAEELKRKYTGLFRTDPDTPPIIFKVNGQDHTIDQEELNEIAFSRMDEIFNELVLEDVEQSGWSDYISKIVITGGGALLQDLEPFTKEIFKREVRIGKPINLDGLSTRLDSPVFSTAVGLVLHAMDDWEGQTDEPGLLDRLFGR